MGEYIVKLDGRYLLWGTIQDSPTTELMTLEEFETYYRNRFGSEGMRELPRRMERVAEQGHSCMLPYTLDELLANNRAGENETELSKEQIVQVNSMRQV